jgi:tripartite-type tricarboxylate transporter receptor subunit TctC
MSARMTIAVAGLAVLIAAAPAGAADYPSRPITLVAPFAAGSTTDILARTIGNEVSKRFGQSVVVDDRPGAGGTIAMAQVARAAPDGYTIAVITQATHVFNVALYPKLGYDPVKDFAPIAPAVSVSNVMILHPSNPARQVADVIAAAKARPGALTFSSGGNGTSHQMSGMLFQHMTGTQMTHVPYRGAPQGIAAVMSNEVTMGFFNTPTVIAQIRDGKLKALGVTSLQRSPHLPELPTLDEAGLKGYEVIVWFGFAAPAGTPPAIIARWHAEIARLLGDPAMRDRMIGLGFDLMEPGAPAAFAQFIQADAEKWLPIVKASGATVD